MDRVERLLERAATLTLNMAEERDDWKKRMEDSDRRMAEFDRRMAESALRHAEIDEALSALVHIVDEWIRNNPRTGPSPA